MIFVNICTKHKKYFQIMNTSDSRESDSDDIRHPSSCRSSRTDKMGISRLGSSCGVKVIRSFEIVKNSLFG